MVKKYVKIWPWHHRGPLFAIIAPIPFVWLKPDGTLRGSIQNACGGCCSCDRRDLYPLQNIDTSVLWLQLLPSYRPGFWTPSSWCWCSSSCHSQTLKLWIQLTSLEFMTKDWQNFSGCEMVVWGSQHRRKSHWAANYVSGSDSSRNGKVDWYLLEYDTSAENTQTCGTEENTKFHKVWPCILSSSSYHCCWAPRPGWRRLGIDTQSPNPLLNFGMANQWTLQTIILRLIYFGHLLTSLLNASFIFEQCCHAARPVKIFHTEVLEQHLGHCRLLG